MSVGTLEPLSGRATNPSRFGLSFNFAMALLMAAVLIGGFSQTIAEGLIHPSIPRPALLYVHGVVFSAWMVIYVIQTGLVAFGNVKLHRRLGPFWLVIGAAVPIVGFATAIVMRRFRIIQLGGELPFVAVPLWDMVIFTPLFLLAVLWRKRPEFHRRLMFLATCCLMDAGFARFPLPDAWFEAGWFYAAVDGLVLIAVARDLVIRHSVHVVYAVALPVMVAGQIMTWLLWHYPPAIWIGFCRKLVGIG